MSESTSHESVPSRPMPSVSVTIVSHQARDHLRKCLYSLEQHPYSLGPMEIVVLDNASHDGSIDMLRDEFPKVIVLEQHVRRGFGANQNIAVATSRGEAVFLLNPDAAVGEGTIDALVRALWGAGRVVAAGCPTLNSDGTQRQAQPNKFPTPASIFSKAVGLSRFRKGNRLPSEAFNNRWLSGGAMLVDRQAFLAIGGFDESFFMYAEDVDLCKRLQAGGTSFVWVPEVAVVHPLPDESPEAMLRRSRENVRAELRYMGKHHSRIGLYLYRLGAVLDSTVRIIALSLPGISRSVNIHGCTVENTRTMHRSRLRALLRPATGEDLREAAKAWNAYHAPETTPFASEGVDDSTVNQERPTGS